LNAARRATEETEKLLLVSEKKLPVVEGRRDNIQLNVPASNAIDAAPVPLMAWKS
jgi:hypothetical protein